MGTLLTHKSRTATLLAAALLTGTAHMRAQTYFSQDYENSAAVDWTTSVDGRFTPTILTEGSNHYLSVDQSTRNNNGCVLTCTSLSSKVTAGTDFTLLFDLKISNSSNQTPVSFTIYDGSNTAAFFSLTAEKEYSETWLINSGQTLSLPNSAKANSKQSITDVTWYSIKLTRSGNITYLTITNTTTGEELYPLGPISSSSNASGLGKMEFVTKRYMANFAIDNIVLRSVEDGDTPQAAPTTYTLHYVDEQGKQIKDDITISTVVGTDVTVNEIQSSPIYTEDQTEKYIFVSANSINTVADETQNVITLVYRQAETWSYTVNYTGADEEYVLQTFTGSAFEGDESFWPYPAVILHEGILYRAQPQSSQYRVPISMEADKKEYFVNYSYTAEEVVFCTEGEDIPGISLCNAGNMIIRSSNAACGYAPEQTPLVTLPAGEYYIKAVMSVPSGSGGMTLYKGSEVLMEMTAERSNWTEVEGKLWTDRPAVLSIQGGGTGAGLDFIYIQKTGYVEDVTLDISAQEWAILQAAYQTFSNPTAWNNPWNMNTLQPLKTDLPGVTCLDGHVISIDLSNNNLTGSFPFALLSLPCLKELNLSGNQLSGDIGLTMAAYMQMNPSLTIALEEMNIANNQLSGNIGLFANYLPSLTYLDASDNQLEDVLPMISTNVSTLNLGNQAIQRVATLSLDNVTAETLATTVPSILLYDHVGQTFTANLNLLCLASDGMGMVLTYQDGLALMPYTQGQNTYYGQSGDTLSVYALGANGQPEGTTFRLKLEFNPGDANFNGKVDVLDLQTIILYIFNNYKVYPFNFTAANLWEDEQINVQDVVRMVSLLLAQEADATAEAPGRMGMGATSAETEAVIYQKDDQLMLSTNRPVAAFDIMIDGSSMEPATALQTLGITCQTRQIDGRTRLIGYSLSGATLPVGETVLGKTPGRNTRIVRAQLSDSEAKEISVAIDSEATGVTTIPATDTKTEDDAYRLPLTSQHTLVIGRDGKKTIQKEK